MSVEVLEKDSDGLSRPIYTNGFWLPGRAAPSASLRARRRSSLRPPRNFACVQSQSAQLAPCNIPNLGTIIPNMGMQVTKRSRGEKNMGRKPQQRTRISGVAAALFSATQQRILSILFGQPNRTFFTNEIIELAGTGTGATLRELKKLVECRLVTVNQVGNQKHYQANADSPIFSELCSIVYKTLGIPNEVRKALQPIKKDYTSAHLRLCGKARGQG